MGALARIHNYNRKCFSLISSALQVKKCEKGKKCGKGREEEKSRERQKEGERGERERELGGRPKQNQQIKNKNAKIMLCSINLKTETRVEQVTKRGGSTEGRERGRGRKGCAN